MSRAPPLDPAEEAAVDPTRVGAPSAPPSEFTPILVRQLDANLFVGESATLWRPPDARGVYGELRLGGGEAARRSESGHSDDAAAPD